LELEKITQQNQQNQLCRNRLFEEREMTKEDFELLINERERAKSKLENIKSMYEFEVERN
jgi:exonuclease I